MIRGRGVAYGSCDRVCLVYLKDNVGVAIFATRWIKPQMRLFETIG